LEYYEGLFRGYFVLCQEDIFVRVVEIWVLTAVLLKIQILIDMTPSLWVGESKRFEGFKYEKIYV